MSFLRLCYKTFRKADTGFRSGVGRSRYRGLPLITYAPRGGGGVNTNAYKCVQGGRGGLSMTKNTHFVRRFIENTTIMWKDRLL